VYIRYGYILIDYPLQLSILTINVLASAGSVVLVAKTDSWSGSAVEYRGRDPEAGGPVAPMVKFMKDSTPAWFLFAKIIKATSTEVSTTW